MDDSTAVCEECGTSFVVDDVYATFRSDFESRVGWAFTGRRRPPWAERFCSEAHRYDAEHRRIEAQNRSSMAKRKAKRSGRPDDSDVD